MFITIELCRPKMTTYYQCIRSFILLVVTMATFTSGSEFRKYIKDISLNDSDCSSADIVLSDSSSRSVLECLRLCSVVGTSCRSVFYHEDPSQTSVTCHGCTNVYRAGSLLHSLPGSVYYSIGKLHVSSCPCLGSRNREPLLKITTMSRNSCNLCKCYLLTKSFVHVVARCKIMF